MEKSNMTVSKMIRKYLSGRFSPETEERVQRWIIKDKDKEEKEQASLAYWNDLELKTDAATHAALERVNVRTGYNKEHLENMVAYRKFRRVAAVLIPFLLLAGGLLFFIPSSNEMIRISTAYGEQKQLFLPDSSEIWLNAGSSITYPATFAKDKRLVTLDGEAYFSVKRNTAQPFVVETSGLTVKVLGTKFNVNAYSSEETITTTLKSGKVEVNIRTQEPQILHPNEQLTYHTKTSAISLSEVDASDADSWTSGKLIFTNASSAEIFRILERHYNVVIYNMLDIPSTKRYTLKFLKNDSLSEALDILSEIIGFHYQQNKDKVVLTHK